MIRNTKITTIHGFLRRFPFIDHERFQTLLLELDNPFLSRNVSAEPWDTFSNTDEKKEFSGKFNRTKGIARSYTKEALFHWNKNDLPRANPPFWELVLFPNEQHVFPCEFDPRYQSVIYELEHACHPSLSIKLITSITSRRQHARDEREVRSKLYQTDDDRPLVSSSIIQRKKEEAYVIQLLDC